MTTCTTIGSRTFVAAALLLSSALAADAQELRGSVRLADGSTAAAGVIIEAADSASGAVLARALTSANGAFVLRLPVGATVVVRGLRIGQRPSQFGVVSLVPGEVRTERFTLFGAIVTLDRVEVAGQDVCRMRPADAHLVATLPEEARKALRATQLTSSAGRMVAEWVVENRLTTLHGVSLTEPTVQEFRATTDRPFASLSPDSLARVGYLSTEGESWVYQAPDAEVLLSERFVDEHCFNTVPPPDAERELVGIGFRPAPGRARGVVGIEGTLWLDRASAELRRLDYGYVGVPRELAGTPAGGRVEFRRLPSGAWLVDRWSIRMPRPTTIEETMFSSSGRGNRISARRTTRITSMEVASGAVREIRRGAEILYRASSGREIETRRSADAVASLCESPPGPARGVLWGVFRDSASQPVGNAVIDVEWDHDHRWFAEWQRTWATRGVQVTTSADGFWVACDVPTGQGLRVAATISGRRAPAGTALIARGELGVELDLATAAASRSAGVVSGTVFDSLRTVAPWGDVEVGVLGTSIRAKTDALGRFRLTGVPVGTRTLSVLHESLDFLGISPPTVTVDVRADAPVESVALAAPSLPTLFRHACRREMFDGEGVLLGEVRDVAGARRANVRVRGEWVRMIYAAGTSERDLRQVAAITGADGSYVLCGLPIEAQVEDGGNASVLISGEFTLSAAGDGGATGEVAMQLGGVGVVRRDLIVGGARRVRIGGRVIDQIGQPVAEATVVLTGEESKSARTDSAGAWVMDSVPIRTAEIVVRALRFLPERRAIDPLNGRMTVGEIRLQRAPQILAGQVITAAMARTRAAFEFRRASGVGTYLDEGWIEKHPTITVVTVRTAISKTRLVRDPYEGEFAVRYKLAFEVDSNLQAMATCFPRWFVDGVDFGRPSAAEEEHLLRQAKRIEAYRAMEMPAGFMDFDGCGVILIWTYDL